MSNLIKSALAVLFSEVIFVLADERDSKYDNYNSTMNNTNRFNSLVFASGTKMNFDIESLLNAETNESVNGSLQSDPLRNRQRVLAKVVNGIKANVNDFPYSAFIDLECSTSVASCTGSIISRKLILTAGHCVQPCTDASYQDIEVRVGNRYHYNGNRFPVKTFFVHQDYKIIEEPFAVVNDIAMLLLRDMLTYSPTIQNVVLSKETAKAGLQCVVAGWGSTDFQDASFASSELFFINLHVWNQTACKNKVNGVPPKTFCAGSKNIYQYPYKGDSGAAIVNVDYKKKEYKQVGINSLIDTDTLTCIFVDTAQYYNWITDKINQYNTAS